MEKQDRSKPLQILCFAQWNLFSSTWKESCLRMPLLMLQLKWVCNPCIKEASGDLLHFLQHPKRGHLQFLAKSTCYPSNRPIRQANCCIAAVLKWKTSRKDCTPLPIAKKDIEYEPQPSGKAPFRAALLIAFALSQRIFHCSCPIVAQL